MELSSLPCHCMSAPKLSVYVQQEVGCENKMPLQILYTTQQRTCVLRKIPSKSTDMKNHTEYPTDEVLQVDLEI